MIGNMREKRDSKRSEFFGFFYALVFRVCVCVDFYLVNFWLILLIFFCIIL